MELHFQRFVKIAIKKNIKQYFTLHIFLLEYKNTPSDYSRINVTNEEI